MSPCLLRLLCTVTVHQNFLVLMTDTFEKYWSGILQTRGLSNNFCDQTGVIDFGKKYHRGKVSFSSQHIKGTHYQHDLPQLILILVTKLRQCSPEQSHYVQPMLKGVELHSSLRAEQLHKLFGIFQYRRFVSSPLFTYLSILFFIINVNSWIITLWNTIQYYFILLLIFFQLWSLVVLSMSLQHTLIILGFCKFF